MEKFTKVFVKILFKSRTYFEVFVDTIKLLYSKKMYNNNQNA